MPAQATTTEPFAVSPQTAAEMLSCSRRHVYNLLSARKIKARKSGSRTLIDFQSVRAYHDALPPAVISISAPQQRKAVQS
jgi:excisionase family DNA binding protein